MSDQYYFCFNEKVTKLHCVIYNNCQFLYQLIGERKVTTALVRQTRLTKNPARYLQLVACNR